MVQVIIVVREPGGKGTDYSLEFEVPEVPAIGSYISIRRHLDQRQSSEDMIVRHVWWQLNHDETHGFSSGAKPGTVADIFVECDPAIGPHSSDHSRRTLADAKARGERVDSFDVSRRRI